jgi:hypothetical protein
MVKGLGRIKRKRRSGKKSPTRRLCEITSNHRRGRGKTSPLVETRWTASEPFTAAELLQHARNFGLQLEPRDGGRLAVRPASKLPPDLADELRCHKTVLLSLLTPSRGWQSLPPLDLPLVALRPSPTPAQRDLVIAYLSRQCANQHLRSWLTRRKTLYYQTISPPWHPHLLAYAAARDAACWQLNRTEPGVWSLLEGLDSCFEDLKSKQTETTARH